MCVGAHVRFTVSPVLHNQPPDVVYCPYCLVLRRCCLASPLMQQSIVKEKVGCGMREGVGAAGWREGAASRWRQCDEGWPAGLLSRRAL